MPLLRLSLTGRIHHLKPPSSLHFEQIKEWKEWRESKEKVQCQWIYQRPSHSPSKEKCWKTSLDKLGIIRTVESLILIFWMASWKERGFITLVTQALFQLKSLNEVKYLIQVNILYEYTTWGFIKGKPPRRTTCQANEKRFPIYSTKKLTTRRTPVLNGFGMKVDCLPN